MVRFLDRSVASGKAASRAALVAAALEREMRVQAAHIRTSRPWRRRARSTTLTIWSPGPWAARHWTTDLARDLPGAAGQDAPRPGAHS
ncbi:hypothetical protein [uncultured Ornithinimicrobium sp.]|uniref:hypothetical protein n=1 Tax=uncultured Ornithinimicrobium sp. TaxID=259307 RepID=UPI002597BB97|nr:hypothetical protein [uncultured Ornithinimicrobium sp.]